MKRSVLCALCLLALAVPSSVLFAAPAPEVPAAVDCGTPSPLAFLNEAPFSPVQSEKASMPGLLPETGAQACCTPADNQACKAECTAMGCTGGGSICIHTCECKPCFCP